MEPGVAYEFWFLASTSVLAYELWFVAWASVLAGARMLWESARMCSQSRTAAWKSCACRCGRGRLACAGRWIPGSAVVNEQGRHQDSNADESNNGDGGRQAARTQGLGRALILENRRWRRPRLGLCGRRKAGGLLGVGI